MRVRIYIRSASIYFIAQLIGIFLGLLNIYFSEPIGLLIVIFLIFLAYCKYHLSIAIFIFGKMKLKKPLLIMIPIFILSSFPIYLSIYYNEFIADNHLPLSQKNQTYRIISYIFHSTWLTVFLWELYFLLFAARN